MKKQILFGILAFTFLFLTLNSFAELVVSPNIVNHKTKQCLNTLGKFMEDECTICSIEGLNSEWQQLDSFNKCPTEYELIELEAVGANYICQPLKGPFCCTIGHSGSAGDCKDLIINNKEKKCAFLENDTTKCYPPKDWEKSSELCPIEYKWIEDQCSKKKTDSNQNYL
ncbi:hypothetical protein KKB11_00820, partial [Candidatus Micrarchaeota archaeon]|nr:hypothetical protein [Candidatus Micrarchaeota archaeon]